MSEFEASGKGEHHLQPCLTHFYDYAFLYQHPLLVQMFPDESEALRVQHFRERVTEAIERLRPDIAMPFHAKAARAYNVLVLRYIDQLDIDDILRQLALSRRQYFREHTKALEALTGILLQTEMPTSSPAAEQQPISLESEIASLYHSGGLIQVDLDELLRGVIEATHSLASQRGLRITLAPPRPAPTYFRADRVLLRQITLSLCSGLIALASPGSHLHGDYCIDHNAVVIHWQLQGGSVELDTLTAHWERNSGLQKMLQTIEATLAWTTVPLAFEIRFPYRQYTVLVVDDNPDVVELFRRYLANQPFVVVAARDGEQALQLAQEQAPQVIVLDIMLPRQDGLEILQKFKTHARTQHIPVLVCSVLDSAELVLSLGAQEFIRKPPGQPEFMAALSRWLG